MLTCCHRRPTRYGSHANQFRKMEVSVFLFLLLLVSGGFSEEYDEYYEEGGMFPSPCPYRCTCTEVEVDCSNANLAAVPYTLNSDIQRLIVAGNSISSIDSITSRGFHSLKYIDASSNFISSLDWSSFASMTNLEELYLQMNNLFIVDLSPFYLSKLNVLNVSGNKLVSIVMGEEELPINHLYIQDCDLTYFNLGASNSFPELNILYAGGNNFNTLPNGALKYMTRLRELKLNNCGLSSLSEDTFSSNAELEILDLSNNLIANLPDGIFPSSLSQLNLSGNRWLCDCSLIWLKIFMESIIASGGVIEDEGSTLCIPSEEISSTVTGTSAYSFSGCSGNEQLQRSARSATAFTSLNWNGICSGWQKHNQYIQCGPEKVASCVYDFSRESYIMIQYKSTALLASTKSLCRDQCANTGSLYFVYETSLSQCLCSNHSVESGCNDCSLVSRDSPGLCNNEFSNILGSSSVLYDSQIGLSPDEPETNNKVNFTLTGGVSTYDIFAWDFGDGGNITSTHSSRNASHIFLYPGIFKITVFLNNSNNALPPFQMSLNVTLATPYEPGEISCPEVPVSTYQNIDMTATFSRTWRQRVKWTMKDDSQSPSTFMEYEGECESNWISFRNRCVLPVLSDMAFNDAFTACSSQGARLIRLHSEDETECLISNSQLFPSTFSLSYYTGAQWQPFNKNYQWMSSGDQAFIDRESLNSSQDGSCVAVDRLGLKGVDCSAQVFVLCEKDPTICVSSLQSSSKACYVQVSQTLSWEDADSWCKTNYSNGMLAMILEENDNSIVESMISSSSWIGLQGTLLEGHFQWSNGQILTSYSNWAVQGTENCVTMQTNGQWMTSNCFDHHEFVCQYYIGDELNVEHLVTGLPFLTYGDQTVVSLDSSSLIPTSSPSTLVIFPGCNNDSPWYTCKAFQSNTCNILECDNGSYFCTLTQSCLLVSQPCTCSSNASIEPTINCFKKVLDSDVPNYTLIHRTYITVPPGSSIISSDVNFDVSEGDVIGFQSEYANYVKCEDTLTSGWTYPRIQIAQSQWMNVGDSVSIQNKVFQNTSQCYVSAVYTTESVASSPNKINYLTSPGSYTFSVGSIEETGQSVNCSVLAIDSIEGLSWVYPAALSVRKENDSNLLVSFNVIAGVSYSLVVKLLRGSNANTKWTVDFNNAPSLPMSRTCPNAIASLSESCQYLTSFLSNPYSSITHTFDYNPFPTEIMVNTSNELSSQTIKVLVSTYERITNVTLFHNECSSQSSCEITVEVNHNETFLVNIQPNGVELITVSENGLIFSSLTTNLTQFSRIFTMPGNYILEVNASNVVSFMNATIKVNAYLKANFANVSFTSHIDHVAVGEAVDISASAKVTLGSYYVAVWSIGSHTSAFPKISAADTTISPSIPNYIFTDSGSHTVSLRLEDAFGNNVSISMVIDVYKRISSIVLSLNSPYTATGEEFVLSIRVDNSTQPDAAFYGMMTIYVDFGDGEGNQTWRDSNPIQETTYSFVAIGSFTMEISVFSDYEPATLLIERISLESQEAISRISLDYNGPKHFSEEVTFTALPRGGSSLRYSLECGDGQIFGFQNSEEFRYTYSQAAVFEAKIIAENDVSSSSAKLTLYAYDENLLQIIKVSSKNCIALNHTYEVRAEVAAESPQSIHYDWMFGNGLTSEGVGVSNVQTVYGEIGLFALSLTVMHPVNNRTDALVKDVCVEEPISGIEITYSSPLALYPPDGGKDVLLTATVNLGSNLTFLWDTGSLTGLDSVDSFLLSVNKAGNFSITLRVSNDLGHESETVVLVVQEIITGLEINCTSCFDRKYVTVGQNISFMANVEYGTSQRYEWTFDNSSIMTYDRSINFTFLSVGKYNVSLSASNEVSQNETYLIIIAQDIITGVVLQSNQSFIEVNKTVEFSVSLARGSNVSFSWICDSASSLQENGVDIRVLFSTAGYRECSVILSNFVSSETSTLSIPVLERITSLSVDHNLTGNDTSNLYAASGETYSFYLTSNTDFLVTFLWEVRQNGTIVHSSKRRSLSYLFPSKNEYTIILNASNNINSYDMVLLIICEERITNFTCISNSSTQNRILVGEILEFTSSIDTGTGFHYEWMENNHSLPFSSDVIQIQFTSSGESKVLCEASNIFGSHEEEIIIKVYEPVSGISIHVGGSNSTLPFVKVKNPVHFSAPNVRGTDLTYKWIISILSSTQNVVNNNPEFDYQFTTSGSYSVKLEVNNDLSSGEDTAVIHVQAPITSMQLHLTGNEVPTGSVVNFDGSVNSEATNVSYTWTIDGRTIHKQTHVETFTLPGTYTITLVTANNVSSMIQTESLTVLNPVRGLEVWNCSAVIPGLVNVVFEAYVDQGSNITYTWAIETDGQNFSSSGQVLRYTFQSESVSHIYLQAENAISKESTDCLFEVHLAIQNIAITVTYPDPDYIFLDKDIVFSVTGDNIMFATFEWTIMPLNLTLLSPERNLNISFSDLGNFTVFVVVKNGLNEKAAFLDFCVKLFQCDLPELSRVGSFSRTVMRSHLLELEVAVNPKGCTEYLAVHSWVVFEADNCNGDLTLTKQYDLGDTATTSPALIIQPRVLETGNYCVRFTTGYRYTPVSLTMRYAVTIEGSHLTAVIRGGTGRTVALGENLCMDGDLSYDPDIVTGSPDLTFSWECVQLTATGGCFQTSTDSRYCYQGFHEGKYKIRLHVSAPGRLGDTAEQIIDVLRFQDFVPIASIVCESCSTLGNYRISASHHVALSAGCENCQCEPSFFWQIYEGQSLVPLTLHDNDTTTGVVNENLVLKKWGPFIDGTDYTFVVSVSCASVSANIGTASLILQSNAPPTGGQCFFSPTEITPLEDQVTVNCPNWFDIDDPNTLINYQIEVDSISSLNGESRQTETYVLYTGTDVSQSVYLSSLNGESVLMRVLIADEFGAAVVGGERNISFGNTESLDYLINQTDVVLTALIKQAAPTSLLQYAIALCQQLNAESEYDHTTQIPGLGTDSEQSRATIRDAVTISLATSVPISTLGDVQQMAFAMRLLTEYSTEYLTEGCQILVIQTMERMTSLLQKLCSNGLDRNDIPTSNMLTILNNLITATNARIYSTHGMWESGRRFTLNNLTTDFRTLRPEISSTVRGLDLTDVTLDEEHRQMVTSIAVPLLESVLVATLQSVMVNEDKIELDMELLKVKALRAYARDIIQEDTTPSSQISFSASIISSVKNDTEEVFQTIISHSVNPYTYGYVLNLMSSMPVQTLSFHETNGSAIRIQNLEAESRPNFYTLNNGHNMSDLIELGLLNASAIYNPLENLTYKKTNISSKRAKSWTIPDTSSYITSGGALHIQIRLQFLPNGMNQPTSTSNISIYMAKNFEPTSDNYNQAKTLTADLMASGIDHRDYTIFLNDLTSTDEINIRAENNDNYNSVELSVAVYYSYCQYFDTAGNQWSSEGCESLDESTATVTVCQCNHLTSFGGTGVVSLSDINFEDLGRIDLTTNPVVFIAIACFLVVFLILAILCRYLDVMDLRRISHIPLCGRDGPFKYEITVVTGKLIGAGTSAHVGMKLYGELDKGEARHLIKPGAFQHNCSDSFLVAHDVNLGDITKILVWHDNTGLYPSWFLSHVIVRDVQTGFKSIFIINSWLSLEMKDGVIQKTVKLADEEDVTKFKLSFASVFYHKLSDFHIWLSVSNRPDHSRFTRFQRASCCLTAVYMYMCVNAIWFGLIKKANDVNKDTYVSSFGWEEVIIALVSAVIVLPIVFALMLLFKKTRCKDSLFQEILRPSTAQTIEIDAVCDMSRYGTSMRTVSPLGDWIPAIDRESTTDSLPEPSDLKRTVPMNRGKQRQNSGSTLKVKPAVPGGGKHELWNEDNIMQNWPHKMPSWIKEVKADVKVKNKSGSSSHKWMDEDDDFEQQLDELDAQIARDEERQRQRQISAEKRRKRATSDELFDSDDEWVHEDLGNISIKGNDHKSMFNPRGEAQLMAAGDRIDTMDLSEDAPKLSKQIHRTTGLGNSGQRLFSSRSRSHTLPKDAGHLPSANTSYQPPTQTKKENFSFPPRFIYINYIICIVLCVLSCIMIMLYGYQFGSTIAVKWLLSLLITVVISFLILEPLKVLALSIIVTFGTKDVEDSDRDLIDIKPNIEGNEQIKDVKFKPLGGFALLQAKEEGKKKQRLHTLIRELVVFTFMLAIFLATVYINYSNSSLYRTNVNILNKFQHSSSSLNLSNLKSISEYWNWTQESMATSIHLESLSELESFGHLMGRAWLRQIRSEQVSCPAATKRALPYIKELDSGRCVNEANDNPDTNPYMAGWTSVTTSPYNYTFSSSSHLEMFAKFGHWLLYQGGGYIQNLGTTYNDTQEVLTNLESDGWLDLKTRAVFMEVTLYSPSDGFASCVTVLTEFPISGGVLTQVRVSTEKMLRFKSGVVDPLMVCMILFTPFIIYFLITRILSLKHEGLKYVTSFWNWVDIWICILSLTCLGLYITCVVMATREIDSFLNNQAEPANLFTTVLYHSIMRYTQATLLFLFHLKIVKQIRFAKPLYKFYVALTVAKGPLAGVALIFILLIFGYANMTHLLYISVVEGYRNYGNAITSLFGLICGTNTFTTLFEAERILTHFVFLSFGLFVYGLTVALIVAVLSFSYKWSRSQMCYKTSLEARDYEMIDFFLKRFKLLTGIEKPKPAFRHVKFEGLPSLPSRGTSSNLSSRQSCPSPISGSTGSGHLDLDSQSLDYIMATLLPTWDQVTKSFQKIEELDKQEEDLTKRLQDAVKNLSSANKNSQGIPLKVFTTPTIVGKPPLDPKASFSHLQDRIGGRKPTLLKGRTSMTPPSTFTSDISFTSRNKRPFSDQGVRSDPNESLRVNQSIIRLNGSAQERGAQSQGHSKNSSLSAPARRESPDASGLILKAKLKQKEAWKSPS